MTVAFHDIVPTLQEEQNMNEPYFKPGDIVEHVRDPGSRGVVVMAEENGLSCQVQWDDGDPGVVDPCVWANKLRLLEE